MTLRGVLEAIWISFGLLLASGTSVLAQTPPTLRPADGISAEGFTRVSSVRELPDGRLMVAAGVEPYLTLVDFSASTVTPLSRTGAGPGEFREVSRLIALSGDTTLIDDRQGLRWILFSGIRPIRTIRTWSAGFNGPRITGADDTDRLLELRGVTFGKASGGPVRRSHAEAESLLVVLHQRNHIRAPEFLRPQKDTLARLRGWSRGITAVTREARPGVPMEWWVVNPLSTEEQALLFPDGWVAIALMQPYRVEWHGPRGEVVKGPPLPFERVPVDGLQQRAAIARAYPKVSPAFSADDFSPWPDILPPFLSGAVRSDVLFALPTGGLAIMRTPDARSPRIVYDIVDRTGRLESRLSLSSHERIIGFGKHSVYVAATDADDLQFVRRHPWP